MFYSDAIVTKRKQYKCVTFLNKTESIKVLLCLRNNEIKQKASHILSVTFFAQ